MGSRAIFQRLHNIHTEIGELAISEALEVLNRHLSTERDGILLDEINITKAKLMAAEGMTQDAVDILDRCSWGENGNDSAAYFAAEILFERGQLSRACEFLERAEALIARTGDAYYQNSIFLLHAFCEMKRGDMAKASRLLDRVTDEGSSLFWLKSDPVVSVTSVRRMISEG